MKNRISSFAVLVALALSAVSAAGAAETKTSSREEKKSLRVISAPEAHRVIVQGDKSNLEKETVAFLGVETSTVSATLNAQLGLPRGTGLVVNHIVPKSPAAEALKVHDVLLKFEDQILIEVRQLSVLIRNRSEGDEVTLTYLRGGQKATAKVKLGKQEIPKLSAFIEGVRVPMPFRGVAGDKFELFTPDVDRAEVDRLLGMIQRSPDGEPVRIQIDRNTGPGFRAITVHTGNSNLVFSDDEGSLELKTKEGSKSLVAKDAKGAAVFSGPVNTPEERKALPDKLRERLEKVEGMHGVSFHTDGDFKGGEARIIRPRGINLPLPPTPRVKPAQQSLFY